MDLFSPTTALHKAAFPTIASHGAAFPHNRLAMGRLLSKTASHGAPISQKWGTGWGMGVGQACAWEKDNSQSQGLMRLTLLDFVGQQLSYA